MVQPSQKKYMKNNNTKIESPYLDPEEAKMRIMVSESMEEEERYVSRMEIENLIRRVEEISNNYKKCLSKYQHKYF